MLDDLNALADDLFRVTPAVLDDGAYRPCGNLASGFGDDGYDDDCEFIPLLAESLAETHTLKCALVRYEDLEYTARVWVPLEEDECAYVEINREGMAIACEKI